MGLGAAEGVFGVTAAAAAPHGLDDGGRMRGGRGEHMALNEGGGDIAGKGLGILRAGSPLAPATERTCAAGVGVRHWIALPSAWLGAVRADVGDDLDDAGRAEAGGAHGQAEQSHQARMLARRVVQSVAGTGSSK